nr:interleukin-6 [Pogona vitticeps]
MRVLLSACYFWAATVLLKSFGALGFPVGDSSGDEEFSDVPCARASPVGRPPLHTSAYLAHWLWETAASWNELLCKEQDMCKGSMEIVNQNNLHLPKITPNNGCYEPGFEKETCLRNLSSGLYKFQTYLEYIEEASIDGAHGTTSIWPSTQRLANNLRSMMNNPDTVTMPLPENQKAISAELREQRHWNATVTKHLILQGFISFMEKTTRAIRHLCMANA